MSAGLISGNENTVRFTLDPRTKLALVATVCTIMISGRVGGIMTVIHPVLALVPFALLLLSGRVKAAVSYLLAYAAAYSMISFVMPVTSGMISILIGATAGIIYRMMPSLITGYFVVSTTKVSEFNAAMERMHISNKITIPMSVMFRFFPSIKEYSPTTSIPITAGTQREIIRGIGRSVSNFVLLSEVFILNTSQSKK